ncbi:SAM-dependent methyltransferase [Streptomyces sp. LX-29]|uniref:SAM-dependent methyltransferase n=1 Tax=Streptomyces sp. LX-29 TaxID=2900152 RepID=UPI00240E4F66|nr:SAM-dependent methyltransferase [Streptomyces sp. LX-29]WFB11546.1 SAM-dependent methyltransferase [Streptomyces sp. LX-29]
MLAPLYEAVYDRLSVGAETHLLALRCGAGLSLLMAAARGAAVYGVEADPERRALAGERLARRTGEMREPGAREPGGATEHGGRTPRTARALPAPEPDGPRFSVVTAFEVPPPLGGDATGALVEEVRSAAARTEHGGAVVLAGWGPPERCATSAVLRVAARLADPMCAAARWRPCGRDDLERIADRAGLRPDGSGRVACPFGYADPDSAVRGLLSTGLFDAAERATDLTQVAKEIAEAVHPHQRQDGTVWMPNVFRYLIARV